MSGRGNAILVCGSIYSGLQALSRLFHKTDLAGKCAIVTSYRPSPADIKGEESGEGLTEKLRQYDIYQKMLADWFNEPAETAVNKAEKFEKEVKKKFIDEPGQMKLLIVVDKLLTGFDAPPGHLPLHRQADARPRPVPGHLPREPAGRRRQGIRLHHRLQGPVQEPGRSPSRITPAGALDGYDKEDVAGLLEDRLGKARERLEEAREAVQALCEPVETPQDSAAYLRYFCGERSGNAGATEGERTQAPGPL